MQKNCGGLLPAVEGNINGQTMGVHFIEKTSCTHILERCPSDGQAEACVVALFLGEMLLKIYGLGCGRFWKGEEAVWKLGFVWKIKGTAYSCPALNL